MNPYLIFFLGLMVGGSLGMLAMGIIAGGARRG